MIGIRNLIQLGKMAGGDLSPENALELLSSLGIEAIFSEVPEDRKADAFQRVAQFSVLPETNAYHVVLIAKDGSLAEALFVVRVSNESNVGSSKKTLDGAESSALSLCQST